jgi:hypothetical protein|nr:glycosyl hydrolase [uncultured Lachnoclostridium sp.]
MDFISEWVRPSNQYRMKPFWFWNGELTCEEIDVQLRQMKEQGLAGAFICPRQGQKIPYLGQRWFERICYACNKAEEYELELWLYDEYPYPSGMSGGEVLLEKPDAVHTQIKYQCFMIEGEKEQEITLGWSKVLYAAAVRLDEKNQPMRGNTINLLDSIGIRQEQEIYQRTGLTAYGNKRFFSYGPQKIINFCLPEGTWRLEIYLQETLDDYKYYGNFFDPCDKQAVKTFLRTTHERYFQFLGKELGTRIKGIFSDEVSFLGEIPWSRHLVDYIRNHYNYNILEVLPALHDKSYPNAAKIRYQLYQSAHELLQESYHKQVSDWCGEHGWMFVTELPSMRRSTQIYSDVPGGDACHEKLGISLEEVYNRYLKNYRSCVPGIASLARQKNRTYAMAESFHSIGWSMTIQDAKWMIDWMAAMGINFFTAHAFYYTIDSITKHDAPPSQFIQNPYWPYYHILADYSARLSAFVSNTEAVCNVALLDPVTSLWTHLGNPRKGFTYAGTDKEEQKELKSLLDDWMYLAKTMLFAHVGFDFLDSEILKEAQIEDGQILIGRAKYSVLILPPLTSIESFATAKIQQFIAQGGNVIATGMLPYEVIDEDLEVESTYCKIFGAKNSNRTEYWQGFSSGRWNVIKNGKVSFLATDGSLSQEAFYNQFLDLLRQSSVNEAEFCVLEGDDKELYTSVRVDYKKNRYIMIGNHGRKKCMVEIQLKVPFSTVFQMDAETGNIIRLYEGKEQKIFRITLKAYESKILTFDLREGSVKNQDFSHLNSCCRSNSQVSDRMADRIVESPEILTTVLLKTSNPMRISIVGKNVYRLEQFLVSIDQVNWRCCEPKTFIELCDEFKWLSGNTLSFTGRFGTPKRLQVKYPFQLYYKTDFWVDDISSKLYLMKDERTIGSEYEIHINGKLIENTKFYPTFINDRCNCICDITHFIQRGKNMMEVQVTIAKDWDGIRDPMYILGEFGVSQGRICAMPEKASYRDTYIEGFPWYSGTFSFYTNFKLDQLFDHGNIKLIPDFAKEAVDCIELLVNGTSLGVKAFAPYEWLCPFALLRHENEVEIRVTNTLLPMLEGSYFDYKRHKTVKVEP